MQVLVHGEQNEMGRLKAAIIREYEDDPEIHIEVHNPRNTQAVELYFRGEKMAKVMGSLAMKPPKDQLKLSGILVKRNFNYHILDPSDLPSTYLSSLQAALNVSLINTFFFNEFLFSRIYGYGDEYSNTKAKHSL